MSISRAISLTANRRSEERIETTIRAAKNGDQVAFAEIYDAHGGRVYALCLRMCGDANHATELVQDVFVRAWENLGSFRGESAFTTWLHRLTVNVVLQERRTTHRRRTRVQLGDDLPPGRPEAVGRTTDHGLRMDLEDAVAGLPETLRTVFVLHDVEGIPHAQIAEQLDLPVGTCRSHLFRARRMLREALK